jgi:hypothetical protein
VFRPGPVWLNVVRHRDGREWVVAVESIDGEPQIIDSGDGPLPRTALDAVTAELRRAWDDDILTQLQLMGAGFAWGLHKPGSKPGAAPESWEKIAARVRRLGDNERRTSWGRKLLERARAEGLRSRGHWTERGEAVLEQVDWAKDAIREVLAAEPGVRRDQLDLRHAGVVVPKGAKVRVAGRPRSGRYDANGRERDATEYAISERAIDAAVADLEAAGEVRLVLAPCDGCGKNHLSLVRTERASTV